MQRSMHEKWLFHGMSGTEPRAHEAGRRHFAGQMRGGAGPCWASASRIPCPPPLAESEPLLLPCRRCLSSCTTMRARQATWAAPSPAKSRWAAQLGKRDWRSWAGSIGQDPAVNQRALALPGQAPGLAPAAMAQAESILFSARPSHPPSPPSAAVATLLLPPPPSPLLLLS